MYLIIILSIFLSFISFNSNAMKNCYGTSIKENGVELPDQVAERKMNFQIYQIPKAGEVGALIAPCEHEFLLAPYSNCVNGYLNDVKMGLDKFQICNPNKINSKDFPIQGCYQFFENENMKDEYKLFKEQTLDKIKSEKDKYDKIVEFKKKMIKGDDYINNFDSHLAEIRGNYQQDKDKFDQFIRYNGLDPNNITYSTCDDINEDVGPVYDDKPLMGGTEDEGWNKLGYLADCPIDRKLSDSEPCDLYSSNALGVKEKQLDSTTEYFEELRKKTDDEIKFEYATLLRIEGIKGIMQTYFESFDEIKPYPGNNSKDDVCRDKRIFKGYKEAKQNSKPKPFNKEKLAKTCKNIKAQFDGEVPHCTDNLCGLNYKDLHKQIDREIIVQRKKMLEDVLNHRINNIKQVLKNDPIATSLYEDGPLERDAFPDLDKCSIEENIDDKFLKGIKDKYRSNLNAILDSMCSPTKFPNYLLFKDKNLTNKINSNPLSPYKKLQPCIEKIEEMNAQITSDALAIVGLAGVLAGILIPPIAPITVGLSVATTSVGVSQTMEFHSEMTELDKHSAIVGDVDGQLEREDELHGRMISNAIDIALVGTGVKGLKPGTMTSANVRLMSRGSDITTGVNTGRNYLPNFEEPPPPEFYLKNRKEKEKYYKDAEPELQRYVKGYKKKREELDTFLDSEFGAGFSYQLSDLEAKQLEVLYKNSYGKNKEVVRNLISAGHQGNRINKDLILAWCTYAMVYRCPKSNSELINK